MGQAGTKAIPWNPSRFHLQRFQLRCTLFYGILVFWQICLVNDPRPQNPYNRLYTVEYLGNMAGGRKTLYNNQPVEVLKKLAAASIKDGEVGLVPLGGWHRAATPGIWPRHDPSFSLQAVWFGCDVAKHFYGKLGINDLNMWVENQTRMSFGILSEDMNSPLAAQQTDLYILWIIYSKRVYLSNSAAAEVFLYLLV